jgi:hypothetical protein
MNGKTVFKVTIENMRRRMSQKGREKGRGIKEGGGVTGMG